MSATLPFGELCPRSERLPAELRERLLTPALLVDMDAVRRNVARVVELCGGAERWRPHLKTTKSPDLWSALVDAGVRHFKVATTRELQVLLAFLDERGFEGAEVLVALGTTRQAAARTAELAEAHPRTRVAMLCENRAQLDWIRPPLGVFVDVNPGGDRTGRGFEVSDELLALVAAASERLHGLHCYEGHLHGAFPERAEQIDAVFASLRALIERCEAQGAPPREIVTSGTPAFRHVCATQPLADLADRVTHRVSPGTVVLHDLRSELENPELGLEPAAVVLARVVSRPRGGRITLDAGSKAVAAEAGDPIAAVTGHGDWIASPPSEEHLPLDLPAGATPPELGALLELVPRHVCPTVNLHERMLLVDGDGWRTGEVEARAHDLWVEA